MKSKNSSFHKNPRLEDVLDALKSKGLRLTQSRKNLVKAILSQQGHWTIQEFGDRIKDTFPAVGIATIYRTIALLREHHFLHESVFGDQTARYEVATQEHHDHLRCLDCGEIFEFENESIERLQKKVAEGLGFELFDHTMQLFGHCRIARCPRKPKTTIR